MSPSDGTDQSLSEGGSAAPAAPRSRGDDPLAAMQPVDARAVDPAPASEALDAGAAQLVAQVLGAPVHVPQARHPVSGPQHLAIDALGVLARRGIAGRPPPADLVLGHYRLRFDAILGTRRSGSAASGGGSLSTSGFSATGAGGTFCSSAVGSSSRETSGSGSDGTPLRVECTAQRCQTGNGDDIINPFAIRLSIAVAI